MFAQKYTANCVRHAPVFEIFFQGFSRSCYICLFVFFYQEVNVHWLAFQGQPTGSAAGVVEIPLWTTGSPHVHIAFPAVSCFRFALIICFPMGQPPGNRREPRGNGAVLIFLFSPRKRGVAQFWKRLRWTTGTYPRELGEFWFAVYRSRPKFFRAILFHFGALNGFRLPWKTISGGLSHGAADSSGITTAITLKPDDHPKVHCFIPLELQEWTWNIFFTLFFMRIVFFRLRLEYSYFFTGLRLKYFHVYSSIIEKNVRYFFTYRQILLQFSDL